MHSRRKATAANVDSIHYLESPPEDGMESDKPPSYRNPTFGIRIGLAICLLISALRLIYLAYYNAAPSSIPVVPVHRNIVVDNSELTPENPYYTRTKPGLRKCSSTLVEKSPENFEDLELSVVAYAGGVKDHHPGFKNFMASLALSGYKNIVLKAPAQQEREILNVKGKPNYTAEAIFWVNRLREFQRTAAAFPPSHVLIFCDAFDVLVGLSPAVFLERFESLHADVVFSSEMLCDTISCRRDMELTDWFSGIAPSPKNPFKFLNAGMMAGRAGAVAQFMACAVSYAVAGRDDQTAFAFCFRDFRRSPALHGHVQVTLDYFSLLFGNIPPVEELFARAFSLQEDRHLHIHMPNEQRNGSLQHLPTPYLHRHVYFTHPLLQRWGAVYSPALVHVPGLAFRPLGYSQFNQCQQFLKWKYNQLAASFEHGLPPNIFYPAVTPDLPAGPNSHSLDSSESVPADSRAAEALRAYIRSAAGRAQRHSGLLYSENMGGPGPTVVLCAVFDVPGDPQQGGVATFLHRQIQAFLSSVLEGNKVVILRKVYVRVSIHKAITAGTMASSALGPSLLQDLGALLEEFEAAFALDVSCTLSPVSGSDGGDGEGGDDGTASSVLQQVLVGEKDPLTRIVVVWPRENILRQSNFIDILFRHHYLHPGSAFGFGGWIADVDGDAIYLRSSSSHQSVGLASVDILDFASAVIFSREMIGYVEEHIAETAQHLPACSRGRRGDIEEEVLVSAILSQRGVPRMAVPTDLSRVSPGRRGAPEAIPDDRLIYTPSTCLLATLLPHFQRSWASPAEKEAVAADCAALDRKFEPLPPIADLPGFTWQKNWDPASGTSPCTTHLMTRIVSGVSWMGVGQYMGEGQVIRARGGGFDLTLRNDASFCLSNTRLESGLQLVGCIPPPQDAQKTSPCDTHTEKGHYAAIWRGEVCVFCGKSPAVGGTRAESGHGPLFWCTSDKYPPLPPRTPATTSEQPRATDTGSHRHLTSLPEKTAAMDRVKNRIRDRMRMAREEIARAQIVECQQQSRLREELWEDLYLHVSDDGLFGLFYSPHNRADPHTIMRPEKRAEYLVAGRCFTPL